MSILVASQVRENEGSQPRHPQCYLSSYTEDTELEMPSDMTYVERSGYNGSTTDSRHIIKADPRPTVNNKDLVIFVVMLESEET